MLNNPDLCYQAIQSKDARFDGWFFFGVISTGIYCRPSCPARTPKRENIRFYASAASAQQAGLRACMRCRPDASPGSPEWNVRADVAARAMRLIRDGIVDREGVTGLARRLNYSVRQLNRVITAEVGTGPLALARAQRSQTARILLETTDLPVASIAFASGFSSIRQCNETVKQVFATTPTGLRSRMAISTFKYQQNWNTQGIRLRLVGRCPLNSESVLQFLSVRAVVGIEAVSESSYHRSLRLPYGYGVVSLTPSALSREGPIFVDAELHLSDLRDLTTAVSRCRQLLDLDADPVAILMALGDDPLIGSRVTNEPGRRVPGAVDGFELAVRAIIEQQVSVVGARTITGRLVMAAGEALPHAYGAVSHLFPTPSALITLAHDDPGIFSMPASRRQALVALAEAVNSGDLVIDSGTDPTELRRALVSLPGIGPWTAEYVAMRALRDPDAFMPTDLGVKRAIETLNFPRAATQLATLADNWRPWRSYAMVHLWSSLSN